MTLNSSLWGLFLMLANLLANRATGMEDPVVQPHDFISVQVGESLELECRVADETPGAVKWFLGNGPDRKLIYTEKHHDQFKGVKRHKESSVTDFTITLHNVTLEDAGTYYCVKQKRKSGNDDRDWKSGQGTQVVVTGMEEAVVVQPHDFISVQVGESLELECRVATETPGAVKWFLGNDSDRKLIYTEKLRDQFKRVQRHRENSSTDFTITLHNVTLEDTGTYYCVKQKRISGNVDRDWKSGQGTQVAVTASTSDRYIIPTVVCVLLAVVLAAAIYFYIRKKRGWNSGTSRSETSLSESTKTPNQQPGDNEIVYSDLKHPEGLPRAKTRSLQESSEYAAIKIRPTVSGSGIEERKDASLS